MSKFNKGDKVYHKETGRVLTFMVWYRGDLTATN